MTEKLKLPDHIHLYKRIDLVPSWKSKLPTTHKHYRPSRLVFVCQKPLCNHQLDTIRAIGKLNECNICHRPFVMDKETVQRAMPRCQDCIVRKQSDVINKLDDFLKDI